MGKGDLERRTFQPQHLHFLLPKDYILTAEFHVLKPLAGFWISLSSPTVECSTTCAGQALCSNFGFTCKIL